MLRSIKNGRPLYHALHCWAIVGPTLLKVSATPVVFLFTDFVVLFCALCLFRRQVATIPLSPRRRWRYCVALSAMCCRSSRSRTTSTLTRHSLNRTRTCCVSKCATAVYRIRFTKENKIDVKSFFRHSHKRLMSFFMETQVISSLCELVESWSIEIRSGWRPLFASLRCWPPVDELGTSQAVHSENVSAVQGILAAFVQHSSANPLIFSNAAMDAILCMLHYLKNCSKHNFNVPY